MIRFRAIIKVNLLGGYLIYETYGKPFIISRTYFVNAC